MHDDHEPTSWRDDLRVDMVHEFLSQIVAVAEVAEVTMPHIVICRDGAAGTVSYAGPFPDGLSALVHAERESALDRALNDGGQLTFTVAALYPGIGDDVV
ncbi:MAG: hypothetical protein EOO67_19055 [Microbacterium sp.]|nr:MAG: hypothetical protein EOO67_19055 [Microbacterium sp.]